MDVANGWRSLSLDTLPSPCEERGGCGDEIGSKEGEDCFVLVDKWFVYKVGPTRTDFVTPCIVGGGGGGMGGMLEGKMERHLVHVLGVCII